MVWCDVTPAMYWYVIDQHYILIYTTRYPSKKLHWPTDGIKSTFCFKKSFIFYYLSSRMFPEHISDGVILLVLSWLDVNLLLILVKSGNQKKWKAQIIPSLDFSSYIVYNEVYKFLAFYVLSITLLIINLYIKIDETWSGQPCNTGIYVGRAS